MGRAIVTTVLVLLSACSDPSSYNMSDLLGSWTEGQSLKPTGYMERVFRFHADGTFTFEVYTYAVRKVSPAIRPDAVVSGHFTTNLQHLLLSPDSTTDWSTAPTPKTEAFRGSFLDDCTFQVRGDRLTLNYVSYPADAPVPTTMQLRRTS